MPRYLLDTDICIFVMRGKNPALIRRLLAISPADLAVSVITVAELTGGALKAPTPDAEMRKVDAFLAPLQVLSFERQDARKYGELRSDLERRGCIIGGNDMLIAAHALSRGFVAVTHNVSEFTRVTGLLVEDWSAL